MTCCISTLTCNNRTSIFSVIDSFLENTIVNDDLIWEIYAQGCSSEHLQKITEKFSETSLKFHLIQNEANEGFSRGMNKLWSNVEKYKYVLILEDDWILDKQKDKEWLNSSLRLMDDGNTDIIFLRKYLNDAEKYQYGWTRHIPYKLFGDRRRFNYADSMKTTIPFEKYGLKFHQIPEFVFSANPHIAKTSSYKKTNVFPLNEYNDKHSTTTEWLDGNELAENWGWAEAFAMEKTINLTTLFLNDGLFYHLGSLTLYK